MKKSLKKITQKFMPQKQTLEHQFLPAVLEITQTPPSPLGRTTAYVIMAVFTTLVLLAFLTRVDIIAVAPGRIISNGKIKLIQPLKSGVVYDIYVRDGQMVKKGQPLINIKFEESENNRIRLEKELLFAQIDVLRSSALLTQDPEKSFVLTDDIPPALFEKNKKLMLGDYEKMRTEQKVIEGQIDQVRAEMTVLRAEAKKIQRAIPNLKETVDIKGSLLEDQLVSKIQYLDLERQLIEYEETLAVTEKRLDEAEKKLETLQKQHHQVRVNFENEVRYKLQEASNKEEILQKELDNARWIESLMEIKAPENGMIQELDVYTVGGVVTPAQTLMKLVPENAPLEIEATLLNKDIGFVREGQTASIKIDSFPYTKYGYLTGEVLNISGDAITHEELGLIYNTRLSLEKNKMDIDGKQVKLSPGMTVTVEIKTGKRRIIEYIMAPFIRYSSESLRER